MKILFWLCSALIVYAYVGYAIWLKVLAGVHRQPIHYAAIQPNISIIIACRNEESNLPNKLHNLSQLSYTHEHLQIIIASDGSTDRTVAILQEHASNIVPVIIEQSNGKAFALNQAVQRATGELLVFLDARQRVDADAISELAACFSDPTVGAASGELLLESSSHTPSSDGLGIYWKMEKLVRKLESASGSVVGVTGAIYAIRRELFVEIPIGTILDDVFVPMNVARMGKRVIFQPTAIARDQLFSEHGKEFSRKVRTLTGNYQLLRLAPWLLSPSNPLLFRFVSHKLMRLMVPLWLIGMLGASAAATVSGNHFYSGLLVLQLLFYVLAIVGMLSPPANRFKLIGIAHTFVLLNAAASIALYNFTTGRTRVWA